MFSAFIPQAALTVERNLAGYLARRGLQSPDRPPTSPAYGQCVYPPEKAHKSVSIPATDRLKGKVLMSLLIDASFRDQRHHSRRLSAQDGDSQQQSAKALDSPYIDAMTYFLGTPDFKISDAFGKERLEAQTTRDTGGPIGRRGSMKRMRRKMRSLFHSQANVDADPIL
ncbi:hypothetical protein KEM55_001303 [Ascosphaera atra]|nr:hypothetical protein KEM55_001303 [Ascosphaera atra]